MASPLFSDPATTTTLVSRKGEKPGAVNILMVGPFTPLALGAELIPSLPRGLWLHPMGHNLARFEASAVLRMAMIKFTSLADGDRASNGVRSLAAAIGVDEDELVSAAVETIHAIK